MNCLLLIWEQYEKGKELVALAREKGLRLGVAPDTFLGAGLQTARFCIERGLIGRVTSARAAINRSQALNAEVFRFIRNPGGGFAYNVGVYYVTALLALLGPVKRVSDFVVPVMEHESELYYASEPGEKWKTAYNNLYTGAPLYGPETPADYGQHRGVGAAEMAWSMICDRPHRASAAALRLRLQSEKRLTSDRSFSII